jgi:hypothetical protein
MDEAPVKCLKCGSTQVHAERRGWTVSTGLFGSSQIILTCLKCGYKFKPGQVAVEKQYTPFGSQFMVLVIIGLVLLVIGIIYAASTASQY